LPTAGLLLVNNLFHGEGYMLFCHHNVFDFDNALDLSAAQSCRRPTTLCAAAVPLSAAIHVTLDPAWQSFIDLVLRLIILNGKSIPADQKSEAIASIVQLETDVIGVVDF